jgi:DNA-binding HxlR family transcriptional regulator
MGRGTAVSDRDPLAGLCNATIMPMTAGKGIDTMAVHKKKRTTPTRTIPANSVSRALALIGDRWSLLMLADAFQGVRRFDDFRRGIGIATNVLTERLNRLVAAGCLERVQASDGGRRLEYRLTPMGEAFYPTALMFWRFDRRWSRRRRLQPGSLVHERCGAIMTPLLVCASCRRPVEAREVRYERGPGAGQDTMPPPKVSRRSIMQLDDGAELEMLVGDSIDYFGDRWTQQVLAAFFLGAHRYEEVRRQTHISTNLLAERLKLLVEHGLLKRRANRDEPARLEYALTQKGHDIYPILLTLMSWGDRWLATRAGPPLVLHHLPCGQRLEPLTVCDDCGEELDPHEVSFRRRPRAVRRAP